MIVEKRRERNLILGWKDKDKLFRGIEKVVIEVIERLGVWVNKLF